MRRTLRTARFALLAVVALTVWACASRKLPEGVPPEKREWYGEFYNPEEYAKCQASLRNRADVSCEYLRLTREEEPEYWPHPNVPRPKLPEAPNPPVYREGMTSKQYFDALCKAEAGEFIYKAIENVEGVYQIRPRKRASWNALMDRYVMEDPYGYTGWEADQPNRLFTLFVDPPFRHYRTFEFPGREAIPSRFGSYTRADSESAAVRKSTDTLQSRYGFTWRGIKRPNDRELSIAGGELIVVDLQSGEVLGIRRGFARSGFVSNSRTGIQWETAEVCPRLRKQPDGWDKSGDFTYWFVSKVLRPLKR